MTPSTQTYNGWANWETWNAALWIGNDAFLYNTAQACVTYCSAEETPWKKFIRCMDNGGMPQTADGVNWNDPSINELEMVEMMGEL